MVSYNARAPSVVRAHPGLCLLHLQLLRTGIALVLLTGEKAVAEVEPREQEV